MADPQEPHSLASTFPNPPPFWKDFTADRIARVEELRKAHKASGRTGRVAGAPDELINLQPPPEPVDRRWRVFGDQYMLDDKLPTLEEQGMVNLADSCAPSTRDDKHFDRALELKRLAKSLLLNFLELSGMLALRPSLAEGKMQDLRTLFINMHHILNEYRPHQARESAIEMMQDHLDRTRAETAAIRTQVDKTRSVLEGLGSLALAGAGVDEDDDDGGGAAADEDVEALAAERDRLMWAATDVAFA